MAPKILIVDDEDVIRVLLRAHFEEHGCRVLEASDGGEGFSLAEKEKPDLIVLDVNMPNIQGTSAAHVLTDFVSTSGIPIIIYTNNEESKIAQSLLFGPKLRFVSKMANLEKIWEVARELLPGTG